MTQIQHSLLLIGESDVGKTHYGAQVLRRMNSGLGTFELVDARNLRPFQTALDNISQGLAAPHTPRSEYTESHWTIRSRTGSLTTDLVWPDYGGELVTAMIDSKSLPATWGDKLTAASGWMFMVRPSQVSLPEDVFTRAVALPSAEDEPNGTLSPQSKLVEILQMLRYKTNAYVDHGCPSPPMAVLLSCYDELGTSETPPAYCRRSLPMFHRYLTSNWPETRLRIYGVSPLGKPLSPTQPDEDYAASGPESQGFVIDEYGEETDDLLAPVQWLLNATTVP